MPALFAGTIDDADVHLFSVDDDDANAKSSSAAAADAPEPPAGGNPELLFLYDADAVASMAGSRDEGVNALEEGLYKFNPAVVSIA